MSDNIFTGSHDWDMDIFEWPLFYFLQHTTNIELEVQNNQNSIKRRKNIKQNICEDTTAWNLSKMMKTTNPQKALGISSRVNK